MESRGTIPFSRFMDLALYCPNLGYYEREMPAPGRAGDFYTSVSVGPVFGRLLAVQFSTWLGELDSDRVQLVEAGAHDGRLALDILTGCERHNVSCWPRLEYWILEPSRRRREWQARTLARFADRVRWFDSPEALGFVTVHGVVFSNELLDAFPVTRLRWNASQQTWQELGVKPAGEGFAWTVLSEPTTPVPELLEGAGLSIPNELAQVLPDGLVLDLAPGAAGWWGSAASAIAEGVLMTVDYGLTAAGLLNPARLDGTLRAYRDHRLSNDILAEPGRQDLTSHVNFTQLQRAGEAKGLVTESFQSQGQFLQAIAARAWAGSVAAEDWSPVERRQFQTLIHPEHLGARFQVLVQRRKVPG